MQWSATMTVFTDSPRWDWTSAGYGIIYITEKAAAELGSGLDEYREMKLPAVIQIPGVSGNTGAGVSGVKKTVEQAVGSDILFGGVGE